MVLEITYLVGLILAFILYTVILLYAWRNWHTAGVKIYFAHVLCVIQAIFCFLMLSLSQNDTYALFWLRWRFFGILMVTPLYTIFALYYAGYDQWLNPRWSISLFLPTLLAQILIWTDPKLFFAEITFERGELLMKQGYVFSNISQVLQALNYLMGFIAIIILAEKGWRSRAPYRQQAWILAGAVFFAGVSSLHPQFFRGDPILIFTPIGIAIGGAIGAWALFGYGLLNLAPIAYEKVFTSLKEPIWVVDQNQKISEINPAAEALLPRGESVIGQSLTQAFPQAVDIHATTEIQMREQFFELRPSPIYFANQQVGQVMVAYDITARRHAEDAQQRLIEALDAYAHMVAHDLKNPLAGIYAFSGFMLDEDPNKPIAVIREHVEYINELSLNMSKVVDEMLLLSTIQKSREVKIGPIQMEKLVRQAMARLQHLIGQRGASIQVADSFPIALGYAPWVEEIWVNYLSNAVKYGGEPPQIKVGAESYNGVIRFWVKDNGAGLSSEDQAKLFKTFQRINPDQMDGHGLGLSIVRQIAERLNGEVGVESSQGQGSFFYFTLPTSFAS